MTQSAGQMWPTRVSVLPRVGSPTITAMIDGECTRVRPTVELNCVWPSRDLFPTRTTLCIDTAEIHVCSGTEGKRNVRRGIVCVRIIVRPDDPTVRR